MGVAIGGAIAVSSPAGAAPSPFDGDWNVTLNCPPSPDGRAMAFSYEFRAQVKDGALLGERGDAGQPGWLKLSGPIRQDGSASLTAQGVTNLSAYALYNVAKGTPFKRAVSARFEGAKGAGEWITLRTCTFAFEKR